MMPTDVCNMNCAVFLMSRGPGGPPRVSPTRNMRSGTWRSGFGKTSHSVARASPRLTSTFAWRKIGPPHWYLPRCVRRYHALDHNDLLFASLRTDWPVVNANPWQTELLTGIPLPGDVHDVHDVHAS